MENEDSSTGNEDSSIENWPVKRTIEPFLIFGETAPAEFIVLNTKLLVCNIQDFLDFDTKFLVLKTKFIIISHPLAAPSCAAWSWQAEESFVCGSRESRQSRPNRRQNHWAPKPRPQTSSLLNRYGHDSSPQSLCETHLLAPKWSFCMG